MAGMPQIVIQRSEEVLKILEQQHQIQPSNNIPSTTTSTKPIQLSLFHLEDERLNKIQSILKAINLNTITPIEALIKLNEIQKIINEK